MHTIEEIEAMLKKMGTGSNDDLARLDALDKLAQEATKQHEPVFISTAAGTTIEEDGENGKLA